MCGSATTWHLSIYVDASQTGDGARTLPYLVKIASRSDSRVRRDNPVTYRLLPGLSALREGEFSGQSTGRTLGETGTGRGAVCGDGVPMIVRVHEVSVTHCAGSGLVTRQWCLVKMAVPSSICPIGCCKTNCDCEPNFGRVSVAPSSVCFRFQFQLQSSP